MEQEAKYGTEQLWDVSSRTLDAGRWMAQAEEEALWATLPPTTRPEDLDGHLTRLIGALGTYHPWRIDEPILGTERADRSYLWWEVSETLCLLGWFDPIGPSWTSFEVCIHPETGQRHLLYLMRHPSSPRYEDFGAFETAEQWLQVLDAAMELAGEGVLPNVVVLMEGFDDTVRAALKRSMDRTASETDGMTTYYETATKIRANLGQPWAYADGERSDHYDDDIADLPEVSNDAGFEVWFDLASSELNVVSNLREIPDAWDGSINFQRSNNSWNANLKDIGPFTLIHSQIGTIPRRRSKGGTQSGM